MLTGCLPAHDPVDPSGPYVRQLLPLSASQTNCHGKHATNQMIERGMDLLGPN